MPGFPIGSPCLDPSGKPKNEKLTSDRFRRKLPLSFPFHFRNFMSTPSKMTHDSGLFVRRNPPLAGLLILLISPLLCGCGGEQDDLMMQAARRHRSDSSDDPVVHEIARPTASRRPQKPVVQANVKIIEAAAKEQASPAKELIEIAPLAERLAVGEIQSGGDSLAAGRLAMVSQALMNVFREKSAFPVRARQSRTGFATLSWRVELLPYMGYPNLYAQFDPEIPWNMPPNSELLDRIPEEFMSPTRHDTTTNFLGPSASNYMFEAGGVSEEKADDGLGNTILLVEVNDSHAVPLTKPQDYPHTFPGFREGIGGLRGGTHVAWGNGMVSLIPNSVTDRQFNFALRVKGEDKLVAADIHQDVAFGPQSDSRPQNVANDSSSRTGVHANAKMDTVTSKTTAPKHALSTGADTSLGVDASLRADTQSGGRLPVPSTVSIAKSRVLAKEIYGEKMDAAVSGHQKHAIAVEMLRQAQTLKEDPAGGYVLIENATSLAMQSGDLVLVLQALHMLVSRYDVDSYSMHMKILNRFSSERMETGSLRGKNLTSVTTRLLELVHQAVLNDRYDDASDLIRKLAKLENGFEDNTIKLALSRLGAQVSSTRRKFEEVTPAFRQAALGAETEQTALELGLFYCFYKGDWQRGIDQLSRCESEQLQLVAQAESQAGAQGGVSPTELIQIGDRWLDLSQRAKAGVYRQNAKHRAVHWYQQSLAQSPGSLQKVYLEN